MENPFRVLLFGDSIARGVGPCLERRLREDYPDAAPQVVHAGVAGETSRDGVARLDTVVDHDIDVVLVSFGMNDWRKGVGPREFRKHLIRMVDVFESRGVRVILMTLNPVTEGDRPTNNQKVDQYSQVLRDVAIEKRVKIADVNAAWRDGLRPARRGLKDEIHPNGRGYQLVCRTLMHVLPRRHTTVLWQYNGREAKCNYRCPYCYYVGLWNPRDAFFGTIDQWHHSFKESFGRQPLILYLAFGEPSIGRHFFDILDMAASEPGWQVRMTSNVAGPVDKIVKTPLARDGRLHINASFHPLAIERDQFIRTVLFLRDNGIEVPVVYVAYPPFLDRLADDVEAFAAHGLLVHLRRFQGRYKDRVYPHAYTDHERRFLARYMDDGSIKYMLNEQRATGKLTYSGLHFFVVDNVGNVGYDSNLFRPYTKYRCIFGNVHQGNFRPLFRPGRYPGYREATVDGVANLVAAGYRELEGNNILSFAAQGGVYRSDGAVHYSHRDTDFENPAIRAEFNFPPRRISDVVARAARELRSLRSGLA